MKVLPDHKTSYITLTGGIKFVPLCKEIQKELLITVLSIKGIHFTAIFIENKEEKSSKFLSVLKVVLM
jgi:phosphoesterase RecJ-like protein